MVKTPAIVPEDQPLTLANLPPSQSQKRLTLVVVVVLFGTFFILAAGLSNIQLRRIDSFVSIYGTSIVVNDLITAVLLFNQFAILRSRALLAISSGYLFVGLIFIPWMLAFPGAFAPSGLLGAGLQSTNWFQILRFAGFPTFVIAYVLLKNSDSAKRFGSGIFGMPILLSVAMTSAIVCAAVVVVIASDAYSPRISVDAVHFSSLFIYVAGCLILWNAVALAVLWIRRRSVLDLWLMVVICAYIIEISLNLLPGMARFSAAWYASRVFGFVSSIFVLLVLLYETTTLYAQLLRTVFSQRREREARLTIGDAVSASIAHEIKQPLMTIVTSAKAGLNWLDRVEPDLDGVRKVLRRIISAGHRANAVTEAIRAHLKTGARPHTSLDINDVIQQALALVRNKLQTHRVVVQASPNEQLPRIRGEQIQLEQVLVNLITNAMDSMATENGERRLSIRSEIHHSRYVMVSVQDTGKGIEPGAVDQIFSPLFTTKTHGMGMGLSICRSIIEAHEGQLWVTAKKGHGAIFHFTVPVHSDGVS